jgi:hypothetical protein
VRCIASFVISNKIQAGTMPRIPDLVLDSILRTQFSDSVTIHTFPEIDYRGRRSFRKQQWRLEKSLGRGGFGEVQLEKCITPGITQDTVRAVKVIDKRSSMDFNRELETIAKFSHDRVSQISVIDILSL